MIEGADWLCHRRFGKTLIKPGVKIPDFWTAQAINKARSKKRRISLDSCTVSALRQKETSGSGKDRDDLIALSSQQVCVSICGSLEQNLKRIFIEYAKQRSNSRIYRPIEKICESYQNPKTTKILELVGLFDAVFEAELKRHGLPPGKWSSLK